MSEPQDGAKPREASKLSNRRKSDKRRCGAKTRGEGNPPCLNFPQGDQTRCKFHGGKTPQAIAGGKKRAVEREAQAVMRELNVQPVHNPLQALSELAGEILTWKDLMAAHVANLQDKLRYEGEHAEQIRGEVTLYERSMDRAVTVLAAIGRLKIDERLAAITEAQIKQMAQILEGALNALGMDYDQKRVAFEEFARLSRKASMGRLPAAG